MKKFLVVIFLSFLTAANCFSSNPPSFKKLFQQAEEEFKKENYIKANEILKEALILKPKSPNALYLHGTVLFRMENYLEASERFNNAIAIEPKEKDYYISLADCYLNLNEYEKAISTYTSLIKFKKKFISAYYKRAYAEIKLKKYDQAKADCETALLKDKELAIAYFYQGLISDSLKNYPQARFNYEKAIYLIELNESSRNRILAKNQPYYFNLGRIYYLINLNDKAIEFYNKSLKLDLADKFEPFEYLIYYQLAKAYLAKGEYSLSISDLNKSIALNNKFTDAFILRGNVYYRTSQFQSAISDFTKAILFNDKSYTLYYCRGKCYYELADFNSASSDYKTALAINPQADSLNILIKESENRIFEKNKEFQSPVIRLSNRQADSQGFINLSAELEETMIEGEIIDQSMLNSVSVNGYQAYFYKDKLNPKFRIKILNKETDKLEIEAVDVYGNKSNLTYKIGKILSDAKLRYDFTGKIFSADGETKPIGNLLLYLLNLKGERIASAKTDENGIFSFHSLPYDKNELTFLLDSFDTRLDKFNKIIITDKKNDSPVITMVRSKGNVFSYFILPYESTFLSLMEVDDSPLNIDFKGKLINGDDMKIPIGNCTINLVNEKGEVLDAKKTDLYGMFVFTRVPKVVKYLFKLNAADLGGIKCSKMVLTDEKGKVIKEFSRNSLGEFVFEILPSDQFYLGNITEEDPYMRVFNLNRNKKELDIIENIYYESGAFNILPEAQTVIQKLVSVLKANPNVYVEVESHTDSQAGDDFNMELSSKRATTVVDYIVKSGIDKRKVSGIGRGESRLTNNCGNGIECSDAEHRQNRRTVFKLKFVEK